MAKKFGVNAYEDFATTWTLLILNAMVKKGATFTELMHSVESWDGRGPGTNLLSERLKQLTDAGYIYRKHLGRNVTEYRLAEGQTGAHIKQTLSAVGKIVPKGAR